MYDRRQKLWIINVGNLVGYEGYVKNTVQGYLAELRLWWILKYPTL